MPVHGQRADIFYTGSSLAAPLPVATQTTKAVTGSHRLQIASYSHIQGLGVGKHISSGSFSVGGCSWAILFYPDGASEKDKQYISLGLTLRGGPWTTHAHFDFSLLEWHGNEIPWKDAESKLSSQDFRRGDVRVVKFMARESFEASNYLKADAFIIQCTVTVMKFPSLRGHGIAQSITIPPCKLRQQLGTLLESGLGADVTFEVATKTFPAHRCVLAARSPVFRAQLFGSMKEKDMTRIRMEEIEAPVFKAMLNFIYTDMIPDVALETHHNFLSSHEASRWMHQHLLVAADRFGLDRLWSTCEFLLCRDLDGDNVSSVLVLAEQHNSRQLKAACLKYMASEKILDAVMATDGFQVLESCCPTLVARMKANCRQKARGNATLYNGFILFLCVLWILVAYYRLP